MPPKKKLASVPCPHGLPAMCKAVNDWGKEWEDWGKHVKATVEACCGGDPEKIPPPPPPPFH